MSIYVFVHVDTNLSNLFFQKLYQRSMPDEHIQNPANYLLWSVIQKY